jgi:ADP-heptose:LPS heptosyltransferase
MKIEFQRKVDRILGTLLCRIISCFYRKPTKVFTPVKAERILVILLSEMGSLVLAYPMFQRIKEEFASASLSVLLFEKNREILEILDVTDSDNILTINNESMVRFIKDSVLIFRGMQKKKFDIAIDCELFARVSSIFALLSGAKIRVGFHPYTQEGLHRGNFINRPVLYNPYHHMSQQFLTMIHAINSSAVPTSKYPVLYENLSPPPVEFGSEEIGRMGNRLCNDFREIRGKKLVLIYPSGGELPIRAWPLPHYCQVAQQLIKEGYAVAVIGLSSDKELAREILSCCQHPYCVDLTGYTQTIRELMLIFHHASLLITNDGGPPQFAALTPIPTIIFFGPETPILYGPQDNKSVVFFNSLACSPCLTAYNHRNSPCDGDNLCLKSISPDRVMAKALEILEDPAFAKLASV